MTDIAIRFFNNTVILISISMGMSSCEYNETLATYIRTFGSNGDFGTSISQTQDGGYIVTGYNESSTGDFKDLNKGSSDIFVVKLNSSREKNWIKTFGGSSWEGANSITISNDGGYVITGVTWSNDGDFNLLNKGLSDVFVIKLNSAGEKQWIKCFGGSSDESGSSIAQTEDGGYILTGFTASTDGDFYGLSKGSGDIFVVKLNSSGEKQWVKSFGGSNADSGSSIVLTHGGGYVLTGSSDSGDGDFTGLSKGNGDAFVIKLDSSGDIQWIKNFGGSNSESGASIVQSQEGNYILTGTSESYDGDFNNGSYKSSDIFVIKLNSSGEKRWVKRFGGSGIDEGASIAQTRDGSYVLTGNTRSTDGDFRGLNKGNPDFNFRPDIFVIKLNSAGEKMEIKTFGGDQLDVGESINANRDGSYIITGCTQSIDGDFKGLNQTTTNAVFVIQYF